MGPKRMNVGHVTLGLTPTRPAHGHAHRALMGPSRLNPAQLLAFCARRIQVRQRGARLVSATLVTTAMAQLLAFRAPRIQVRRRGARPVSVTLVTTAMAQLLAFRAPRIHIRRRGARPVSATLVTSPTVPRVVRRACPGHMPRSRGM